MTEPNPIDRVAGRHLPTAKLALHALRIAKSIVTSQPFIRNAEPAGGAHAPVSRRAVTDRAQILAIQAAALSTSPPGIWPSDLDRSELQSVARQAIFSRPASGSLMTRTLSGTRFDFRLKFR